MKDEAAERNIFEGVELTDEQRIVQDALAELAPRQQVVIQRHYFQNMTIKQIAEEDGCAIHIIRQCENRALSKLRRNHAIRALNKEMEVTRPLKGFDPYHRSPEYYNAKKTAQRLETELLQSG